jgi:hypothetical protein
VDGTVNETVKQTSSIIIIIIIITTPNQHPIEIESNRNRIGSNHTSPPGDFLFQFDSSHIIRVWYHNTSQEVQIESKRIDLELNRSWFEIGQNWYQIGIQSKSNRILIESDRIAPHLRATFYFSLIHLTILTITTTTIIIIIGGFPVKLTFS